MSDAGHEFFDHTADVGIQARGATLEEAFVHAAQGLMELIVEGSPLTPREERLIALSAGDAAGLLRAWLQELLFWFSTDRFLAAAYALETVSETALRGRVQGERFDPSRHRFGTEVKGITRHQLSVRQLQGQWQAQVVVDV